MPAMAEEYNACAPWNLEALVSHVALQTRNGLMGPLGERSGCTAEDGLFTYNASGGEVLVILEYVDLPFVVDSSVDPGQLVGLVFPMGLLAVKKRMRVDTENAPDWDPPRYEIWSVVIQECTRVGGGPLCTFGECRGELGVWTNSRTGKMKWVGGRGGVVEEEPHMGVAQCADVSRCYDVQEYALDADAMRALLSAGSVRVSLPFVRERSFGKDGKKEGDRFAVGGSLTREGVENLHSFLRMATMKARRAEPATPVR